MANKLIRKKQIKAIAPFPIVVTGFSANGGTDDASSAIATRLLTAGTNGTALTNVASTGEDVVGVVKDTGKNRIEIRNSDKTRVVTAAGFIVYARITYSASVYTLTYYYINGSGVETAYSIAGPITISFLFYYRSAWKDFAADESTLSIVTQMGFSEDNIPMRITYMYGGANNKFITTDSNGKFIASFTNDATGIPFASGAGLTATNVADALDELVSNPFPTPIQGDVVIDDTYRVLPNNGDTFIDMRYLADDVLRLGSKYDFTEAWAEFKPIGTKIAFGANTYVLLGASTITLNGVNVIVGTTEEIFIKTNTIPQATLDADKLPVVISGRDISINDSVVNTVGLGGFGYTIKTDNATYILNLILPDVVSGFETSLVSSSLAADVQITLPTETSNLVFVQSALTAGTIPVMAADGIELEDSIITNISDGVGINTAAVSGQILTVETNDIAGTQYGAVINALGNTTDDNVALKLEAGNGGSTNTALEIVGGDVIHSSGLTAIGTTIDLDAKVNVLSSDEIYAIQVENAAIGLSLSVGGSFNTSGASTENIAMYLTATGGTTNYSLVAANGQAVFGATTATTTGALVEFKSTSQAVLFPRMTTTQKNAIPSPTNGMIVYDTTVGNFYGYIAGSWTLLTGTGVSGSGTTNTVSKWTSSSALGNSLITDDGTKVMVNGMTVGRGAGNIATNTGLGVDVLRVNTTGYGNVAIGNSALYSNTTSFYNTVVGYSALYYNTTGYGNTASGFASLYANVSGTENTGYGAQTLYSNTTGGNNTAIGTYSMYLNTIGNKNVTLGVMALYSNKAGSSAVAIGYGAMQYCNDTTTGFTNTNTAVGYESMKGVVPASGNTGLRNTAFGYQSLTANSTGGYNTVIGYQAGNTNTTGSRNTYIGYGAAGTAALTNATAIGAFSSVTASNALILGSTGDNAVNVGVGITAPNTSAILDLTSTKYGFLPPRMTTTQRDAIVTPAAGMIIYNTTTSLLNIYTTVWGTLAGGITGSGSTNTIPKFTGSSVIGDSLITDDGTEVQINGMTIGRGTGNDITNTVLGNNAFAANVSGVDTTAIGAYALAQVTTGSLNVGVGGSVFYNLTTGGSNVGVGGSAGSILESGSNNTIIGHNADVADAATSNSVALGYAAIAETNEFALSSAINKWKFRDNSYTLPASYPTDDESVLSCSASGVMSWAPGGGVGKIGELMGVDLTSTSDQQIALIDGTSFIITDIVITNASTAITTATGAEFWTGTHRTGTKIVAAFALTDLAIPQAYINIVNGDISIFNGIRFGTLYFSLDVVEVSPATVDIRVYGYRIA